MDPPGVTLPRTSRKDFAVYSQNDWRATSRLTVNLGLRWEVNLGRPRGPTACRRGISRRRAPSAPPGRSRFLASTATAETCGIRLTTTGDRGSALRINGTTGPYCAAGSASLPATNTGYFRARWTTASRTSRAACCSKSVRHEPGGRAGYSLLHPAPVAAIGGNPKRLRLRHRGGALRPPPRERAGPAMEFLHRARARCPLDGVDRLQRVGESQPDNRSFPIQNLQSIDPALLSQWRVSVHRQQARRTRRRSSVQSPWQPATGPLAPFAGVLGQRTIPRQNTLFPYPLLVGSNAAVNLSQATADYHAMILRVTRRYAQRRDAGRDLHLVEGDRQHRHRRRQPGLQRRGKRARREPQPLQLRSTGASATATSRIGSWRRSSTSCRSARANRSARRTRWSAPCSADGR